MTVRQQMQSLLDHAPGLEILGLGDPGSGLILDWTARASHPREVLDRLGEQAVAMRELLRGIPLPPGVAGPGPDLVTLRFSPSETEIFLGGEIGGTQEILCAVCQPGAKLGPVLAQMAGLARRLAERP